MRATSSPRSLWASTSLALLVGCAALIAADVPKDAPAAKEGDAAVDKVGEDDIDIVMHGQPIKGRVVLPPTDKEFKFKMALGGQVIQFRWAELEEPERKRVQKLYGMEIANDGRIVFGE